METLSIKDKFAVLVISCDKYSDLWKPFFQLFWRFWPDCPFKVYLLSNNKAFNHPKVTNILVGDDISWSDNLRNGINQLNEDYIFLFLDDLFLYDFVKTDKVKKVFNWILQSDANCVKMVLSPKSDKPYNELVGIVSKGTIYRTTTVLSVWKKDILLDLLKLGESAWDFEIYGTVRSDKYDGFYSTWEDCFPVINGVIKGKWQRGAVRRLNLLGIKVDLNRRQMMTKKETVVLFFKELRSKMFKMIPAKYRRKVKDFILGGKYNYEIKKN